jgi:hypothetical protein
MGIFGKETNENSTTNTVVEQPSLLDKKPKWSNAKPGTRRFEKDVKAYGEWRQALDNSDYNTYGNEANARAAYSMGHRDEEALMSMNPLHTIGLNSPITVQGNTKVSNSSLNGQEFNSMDSTYTHTFSNGQVVTTSIGEDSNGGYHDAYGYTLPDGGSVQWDFANNDNMTYTPPSTNFASTYAESTLNQPITQPTLKPRK